MDDFFINNTETDTKQQNRLFNIEKSISSMENVSSNMISNITNMSKHNHVIIKNDISSLENVCSNIIPNITNMSEHRHVIIKNNISSMENVCSKINIKLQNIDLELKAYIDTSKNSNQVMANIEEDVSTLYHNLTEVDNSLSETLMDIKDAVQDLNSSFVGSLSKTGPANCNDLYNEGMKTSAAVQIFPYSCCPDHSEYVVCDQQFDLGRWTIIQRRQDVRPRENFYRGMSDYVRGFGMLSGEFWIGLKLIHELTTHSKQELHITLEDWDGNVKWARYSTFKIGSAEDNYRLNVTGYSGDAGDALSFHQGQAFSTFDEDNDPHTSVQC
ncbi:unnamed protein product, partial [Meganyctiphanes norvegica]